MRYDNNTIIDTDQPSKVHIKITNFSIEIYTNENCRLRIRKMTGFTFQDERDPEDFNTFRRSEEQKDEMLSRYRNGETYASIANTLGVTNEAARHQILRQWRKHPDYGKKPLRENKGD